jgi:hypothetical protein
LGKPFRKQSSVRNPAGQKFGSRPSRASIPTANADSQQSDKEEEEEKKPWYKRTPVIVALIPAAAALLITFFQFVLPILIRKTNPTQPHFAGVVADERTGKVVPGARVSLEAKGVPPVIRTDSEGAFSFVLSPDVREIKIRVDKEGYYPFDRRIDVTSKNELEDIRLKPLNIPSPSPSTKPIEKAPVNANKKVSDLAERQRRAREYLNSSSPRPKP